MAFKPLTLISPRGIDVEVDNAVAFNNLTNKGYKPKAQSVKPAPAAPVKSDK